MPFLSDGGWLDLICGYLIKSSMILIVAILTAFFLRKKSAGLRHLVLSLFLIGLLFLPFLSTLTTGWETGLLPTWRSGNLAAVSHEQGEADRIFTGETQESGREAYSISSGVESKNRNAEKPFAEFPANLKPLLALMVLGIWIAGCVLLFSRVVLGLFGALRLAREGQNMHDSIWKKLLIRFLEAVSLRRKISLLSHEGAQVPLTWGFIKPVVMMPVESRSWSESQRSTALFHELAHVKRGDFLVMMLARVSRALFWFNPLSWYVFRLIKKEQEKACDELVLKAGIKPSTYAENLLLIRNSLSAPWNPPAAVLGTVGKSHLNERLVAILKQRLNLEEVKMKTKIMLGILAVLTISFIGMARPSSSPAGDAEAAIQPDTVKNAPLAFWTANPLTQEQEKEQQKKKEKKQTEKKAKKEEGETTYVWTTKKGEKGTLEIIIEEKGEKKTIQLKAPYVLTIKKTPETIYIMTTPHIELKKGDKYVLATPHLELKEGIELKKDEEVKWTVKSGKLKLAKPIKEGAVIHVKKHNKEGVEVIELTAPEVEYTKAVKLPDDASVKHTKAVKVPDYVTLKLETGEGETKNVWVRADAHVRPEVQVVIKREIYKKQIEKIREIIKNLKEKDLDASEKKQQLERIEKAIQKLNEQLEHKSQEIKTHNYRIHTSPKHVEWTHKESGEHEGEDIYFVGKEGSIVVGMVSDEGTYAIYFHDEFEEEHRGAFEKMVQKLKEQLPEGCEVESEFGEGKNVIKIKLKDEKDVDASTHIVQKLITDLKEELKKIKK